MYKGCTTIGGSTVPFDDSSLGYTATDLLAKFTTPATAQLTWYDGTSTTLHFQIRYDQPTVHTWSNGDPICNQMQVESAIVSLTTDDGRLSADDFPGRLNGNVLYGPTTLVWQDLSYPRLSDLHGSFRVSSAWGPLQAQTLTLALPARSETCSVCAASGELTNPGFSNTNFGCEYDGKIFWNGMQDTTRGCTPQVTVAAWQWSQ